jgi:uncharacterized membrane protein YkvA (DUF1232 family)
MRQTAGGQEMLDADHADQPAGWQTKHRWIVALCVLYFISPVDFFPELLLGPLGVPDDFVAAVVAIGVVVSRLRADRSATPHTPVSLPSGS